MFDTRVFKNTCHETHLGPDNKSKSSTVAGGPQASGYLGSCLVAIGLCQRDLDLHPIDGHAQWNSWIPLFSALPFHTHTYTHTPTWEGQGRNPETHLYEAPSRTAN